MSRGAAVIMSLVMSVVGLAGCSSGTDPSATPDQGQGTRADRAEDPAGSGEASADRPHGRRLAELSPVPDVKRPGEVVARLALLDRVPDDPEAAPADVRRAAELHQLATRTLAQAPPRRASAVIERLRPPLRQRVAREVVAARRLSALASPQPRLPDWRVVAPPRVSRLQSAYRAAQRRTGVSWEYLAAVHLVETRMGRIRGVSTAGAQGPMQFLPTTWELYGEGGDIHDLEDAVMAAGRLLRANGAPGDMSRALWHYNPSDHYVAAVRSYAANIRSAPGVFEVYRHWRVIYRHSEGAKVLPVGFPERPAVPLRRS
jgi:hypothetical protein